ncbi:helix-turn-helix domain-containing protein [Actinoplanes sp. NPDC051859]|uniref:helix-turn-helix domain-containing protein n=1 Tax=Actinoplanes sp. NPDC051859 TaxID=3363909 RepID=UPI0037AC750E
MDELESFGAALRRLRKDHGWSLRELAAKTHINYGHLSRIENGQRPSTVELAAAVDVALSAKGALVAIARLERSARVKNAVPFDPMRRRSLLKLGVAVPASTMVPDASAHQRPMGKIGVADTMELEKIAVWLYGLDYQHGGATLWQSAATSVAAGYSMLEHGTYGEVIEQRLLHATGRIQMCAGWLAFDSGHQTVARSCYTEALALARQANDAEVEAHALANLAFQSNVLGKLREAARFTEGAIRAASGAQEQARLGTIPQLRRAMTSALNKDRSSYERAIKEARTILDRDHDRPTKEWYAFLSPAELDGVEATCLIELNAPKRAERLLVQAIDSHGGRYARNLALYRVRLARARLDLKEPDGAARAASDALSDLTGKVASWRVSCELDAVTERLAGHAQMPCVAEFLERYSAHCRIPSSPPR